MRRRDRDPRPPVEVVGDAGDEGTVQHVAVVGGGGSRARRALAAGAVIALFVGGLALGDPGADDAAEPDAGETDAGDAGAEEEPDDGEDVSRRDRTTTTRRPRPTTTTTAPTPVLTGSGVRVLLFGGPGGTDLLDLDTGQRASIDISPSVYSFVSMPGGVAVVEGRTARFRHLPKGEPVELGTADQVLPHTDPSAVWLLTQGGDESTTAVLVGSDGGVRAGPVTWDQGWIVGASADGLIGQAGGRVYEIVPGRPARAITTGEPLAVSDGRLMVRACDDTAVCGIDVWERDLRSSRRIDAPDLAGPYYGAHMVVQPGTDIAALQLFGPTRASLSLIDLAGGPHRPIPGVFDGTSMDWLPNGLGLLVLRGGDMLHIHERGDEIAVDELRDVGRVDQLVVIRG